MTEIEQKAASVELSAANLAQLERNAVESQSLSRMVLDYYANGSDGQISVKDNQNAFSRYKFLPRMLRDVSAVRPATNIFGCEMSMPALVSPMAMQQMAHPGGEAAMSRACKAAGCVMIVSTMSNLSIEEIAGACGTEHLWFQLYVFKCGYHCASQHSMVHITDENRAVVESLVAAAEHLGFRALVVTVDAPFIGNRESDERNRFRLPPGLSLGNTHHIPGGATAMDTADGPPEPSAAGPPPNGKEGAAQQEEGEGGSALASLFTSDIDASLTWEFIEWLQTITSLPIVVKGIIHPEDARLAVRHGAAGIIVSNHGGRQLDHAAAPLDVVAAVQLSAQLEATRHVRFAPAWLLRCLRAARSVPVLAAVVVSSGWRAHELPFATVRNKLAEMFVPIQGLNFATVSAALHAGALYYGSIAAECWVSRVLRRRRERAVAARPVPVLLDGGVRRGTDVLKALALGADAVGVGRPMLYALAQAGEPGVLRALRMLRRETGLAFALAGMPDVEAVREGEIVVHAQALPLTCEW